MAERTTVGEIRRVIHEAYPPQLAEPWDAVGLVCGDPADEVSTVAFALDCTQEVADKAVSSVRRCSWCTTRYFFAG